ncbi:MAG: hypothetical protein WHT84_08890 [Breznakiellaceae bacterium]|jgi:hypothetical protein
MNTGNNLWVRIGLALYLSLSGLLALHTIENGEISCKIKPCVIGILLAVLHGIAYFYILTAENPKFIQKFFLCAFLCLSTIILLSITLYQELFRSAFHILGAFFLIFIFKFENFNLSRTNKLNIQLLYILLITIEIVVTLWVFLHAIYGVLLRAPFAQKWVLFNLYTSGYLIIGIFAIFELRSFINILVLINKESFVVDNENYSHLFGKKDLFLLWLLTQQEYKALTCSEIMQSYSTQFGQEKKSFPQCTTCITHKYKATMCNEYKQIYNQILKIKKTLETLHIGTIIQPSNKMKIKEEGWRFEPFQGVTIKHKNP